MKTRDIAIIKLISHTLPRCFGVVMVTWLSMFEEYKGRKKGGGGETIRSLQNRLIIYSGACALFSQFCNIHTLDNEALLEFSSFKRATAKTVFCQHTLGPSFCYEHFQMFLEMSLFSFAQIQVSATVFNFFLLHFDFEWKVIWYDAWYNWLLLKQRERERSRGKNEEEEKKLNYI